MTEILAGRASVIGGKITHLRPHDQSDLSGCQAFDRLLETTGVVATHLATHAEFFRPLCRALMGVSDDLHRPEFVEHHLERWRRALAEVRRAGLLSSAVTADQLARQLMINFAGTVELWVHVVPIQLSMGAWNTLQQSDGHAYWEFNYTTNWIHPLYELPFTGGIPGTFEKGQVGALQSIVPGSGPNGIRNDPVTYGDNPNNKGVLQASGPRDTDKFDATDDSQREFRQRFIPSGLAKEIFLNVYERPASFEPGVSDFDTRLFDAYAAEVARVDTNNDGVISAAEGDVDTASDGFSDNTRLFIPATQFNRFAITREINDGLLAPRFAPSQKGWVMSGSLVSVSPSVPASQDEDADDR